MKIPKIVISYVAKDDRDPLPYRASIYDGPGYHAVGETPVHALLTVAQYWCACLGAQVYADARKCAKGAPKTTDTDLQGPVLTEKKSWREEAVGRLDRMAGLGAEDGTVGGIDRNAHPFWRNRTPDTTD